MKFLKFLFVLVLLLAAVFVIGGVLLPSTVHVERSTSIERSPAHVFAVLNGYRRFNDWSPWAEKDPNASYTYAGPATGVGARMTWEGDPDTVGSGSQEITASVPVERIDVALDFGAHGKADAYYLIEPAADGSKVTWGFDTDFGNDMVGRWVGLMMERMLAPDYEHGLARLKRLVETLPAADISGLDPELIDQPPLTLLQASGAIEVSDTAAVGAQMGALYGEIMALMQTHGISQVGPPVSITTSFEEGRWVYDAAIPVDRNDIETSGNVSAGTSPSGKALRFVHVGPYDGLAAFAPRVEAWLTVHGYTRRDREMDEYISDPGNTPPQQLVTHLIVPVE